MGGGLLELQRVKKCKMVKRKNISRSVLCRMYQRIKADGAVKDANGLGPGKSCDQRTD